MFTDDQLRIIDNLASAYDQWLAAARSFDQRANRLQWKTVRDKSYLYEITDADGNGRSLGPRTPTLELHETRYTAARTQSKKELASLRLRLDELAAQYRALRLPRIDDSAARVLAMMDRAGRLGNDLYVIGTNAMIAYEFEAQDRFATGLDATEDCDLTWSGNTTAFSTANGGLLDLLKRVDGTYTVNAEKPHQVRNAQAYSVDFLSSPETIDQYPRSEPVRALPLPGQSWLLMGEQVAHVVTSRRGLAAQIVAPDPRYFALHKHWLSEQPERERTKARKDSKQAVVLWEATHRAMPRHPINADFLQQLPHELVPHAAALNQLT